MDGFGSRLCRSILDKLLNLSGYQLSSLCNSDKDACFIGPLRGLNEIMLCSARRRCMLNKSITVLFTAGPDCDLMYCCAPRWDAMIKGRAGKGRNTMLSVRAHGLTLETSRGELQQDAGPGDIEA